MISVVRSVEHGVYVVRSVDERELGKRCRCRFVQIAGINHGLVDEPLAQPAVLRHREGVAVRERKDELVGVEGLHEDLASR